MGHIGKVLKPKQNKDKHDKHVASYKKNDSPSKIVTTEAAQNKK